MRSEVWYVYQGDCNPLHLTLKSVLLGFEPHGRRNLEQVLHASNEDNNLQVMSNRKFHTSKISHREKMVLIPHSAWKIVPIRHVFYTNISHFVKSAHVVKLYVA